MIYINPYIPSNLYGTRTILKAPVGRHRAGIHPAANSTLLSRLVPPERQLDHISKHPLGRLTTNISSHVSLLLHLSVIYLFLFALRPRLLLYILLFQMLF